jgi:hypothetical protein
VEYAGKIEGQQFYLVEEKIMGHCLSILTHQFVDLIKLSHIPIQLPAGKKIVIKSLPISSTVVDMVLMHMEM